MTEGARPLVDDFVVLLLLWLETPDIPLTPLTLLPALLLEEIASGVGLGMVFDGMMDI